MDGIKLYFVYCRTSMKAWFQYRVDAFLRSIAVMLREATAIIVLYITFLNFNKLGDWNINELLFLYSFMFLTYGIFIVFFTGLRDFQWTVEKGDFDKILLKPRGALFQILASNSDWFAACGHGSLGIILFIYASKKVGISWGFWKIISLLCCICSGVLIQGAIFLVFASLSFFFIKTDSIKEVLYWNLKKFMGYPVSIYPTIIQYVIVYIIPLAFVNYFPAQLLKGRMDSHNIFPKEYLYISLFIGVFLYILAYYIWRKCMKFYTSTGN